MCIKQTPVKTVKVNNEPMGYLSWYFGRGGWRLLAFKPGSVLSQIELWECFGDEF